MKRTAFALIGCIVLAAFAGPSSAAPQRPNILIIYADDMGFADTGATGLKEIATPNIDSIAKAGVRFTNGYVSACVCSPSRGGLLTGRYQQRFGFDANAEGHKPTDKYPRALDIKQTTFAQRFKELGFATGLVGKWHQGDKEGYLPYQRGFDEFYGILPFGIVAGGSLEHPAQVWRNDKKAETPPDHTIAWGKEAEAFIDRHKAQPFFLYLAFTAVHAPHVAPQSYVDKMDKSLEPARRIYLAMVATMDDAIGGVLKKLRDEGLEENTVIFFASDNGGPLGPAVSNGPLRGGKWTVWEGGIRVPYFIQWKGHIAPGRTSDLPVNQLDWMTTSLAAVGAEVKPEWNLDGANLLPMLEGKSPTVEHKPLFWRFGVQYAVRDGDWKLVKPAVDDKPMLYNLATDIGEKTDLAAQQPEKVKQLQALWDTWNAKNEPPRWIDERWNGLEYMKTLKAEKPKGKAGAAKPGAAKSAAPGKANVNESPVQLEGFEE
jgi:arylsulfatase A-like enzyme